MMNVLIRDRAMNKVLFNQSVVSKACMNIASIIDDWLRTYSYPPTFVVVLDGAFYVASKVFYYLEQTNAEALANSYVTFAKIKSYTGTQQGEIEFVLQPKISTPLVIVIEDVIDTGTTLKVLQDYIRQTVDPEYLFTVVLVDKYLCRKIDCKVDYAALYCDSKEFIVGCGLDYNGRYRLQPWISSI